MKQIIVALCLILPAAAQESFQLEAETSGCFLPRQKKVMRWELRGEQYVSRDSKVVLSVDEVNRFRRELLALPLDNGPSDWDQFDPEVRREAYRKLTEDFGLRPELRDLTAGLEARPSCRLWNSIGFIGGTEWILSFPGPLPLKLKTSGGRLPSPLLTLEEGSRKWDAFSYKALDFLRVLDGKAAGAELDFYLVGDEGRWNALKELQDQPRFNILWQTLERVRQGLKPYGTTHHGYFYVPLHATLERAGMLNEQFTKDMAEELYRRIVARMVRDDCLFAYRDLGFVDRFGHEREFGSRHPHIVLVIEKDSLAEGGIAAARQCGISWIVTGGVARITSVEFFCAALRLVYQGPVTVIDLGDFDPGGWLNGRVFVGHMERYDTPCASGPHYLIRPELYTQQEIEILSRPLSSKDGRVDDWLAESGGINGQPRGIHADWLQPPERILQALIALLEKLSAEG